MEDIRFLKDYDSFTVGVGVSDAEREVIKNIGEDYRLTEYLGLMLVGKNIYRWEGKDKYIQFCFSCNECWDFAIDMLEEGSLANRFYRFCCEGDETHRLESRDKTNTNIFFYSRIFSIDSWEKEMREILDMVI